MNKSVTCDRKCFLDAFVFPSPLLLCVQSSKLNFLSAFGPSWKVGKGQELRTEARGMEGKMSKISEGEVRASTEST